ncbi:MAG: phytoene/squalene synthase family protein [Isosphaeraceae bacterium]|nr:phytoene/squalene synthase family protein [Isosphaeraceae bacterium]
MSSARSEDATVIGSIWKGDRACRAITRHHARTFYFASVCLPRDVRTHAYRVYGFCRWVDNLVDEASDTREAALRLAHARELLLEVYGQRPLPSAPAAFRSTVVERGIPLDDFLALLDGMEMDLVKMRYADFDELELYCHRVAGVVGSMMAHLFGFADARCLGAARALGLAMQLTNILRDVGEDLDRGRIYLPLSELERFGLDESSIMARRVDDRFRSFMQMQIARARSLYRESDSGVPDLIGGSSRLCTRVMGRLYAGILDEIERLDYDVFRSRARVSLNRKLAVLAACQLETISESWREVWVGSREPGRRHPKLSGHAIG